MGVAISWVAVEGKAREDVLRELGLSPTGRRESIPESPMLVASLPTGWTLVYANEYGAPIVSASVMKMLSAGCTAVSCEVEEHVMVSSVQCHRNGAESWRVKHDAQEGIYHLQSSGDTPESLRTVHAQMKKEQDQAGGDKADVDYIHDVPIMIAQALTGFRHDMDTPGVDAEPFEVVVPPKGGAASGKPWWKLW